MLSLTINGQTHQVDVPDDMPLLWVIRDVVGLTGTKFGCGGGFCGCCTVHIDGTAVRSCIFPVVGAANTKIRTIEALGEDRLHPLQEAWMEHQVPQCGYCQSGQLMAAAGLLQSNPHLSESDVATQVTNICRCGTYGRIKTAIVSVASANRKATP
jgi:isoquinoline 1-oxidoreductase subunit alpha